MIGSILNHRYRVIELIGSGGMAHVYKAVNLTNHKYVAIKVIKEEFKDDPEFLRRFEREARAVLHLSHENIIRAYGVGTQDGLPFIIMEYVEGKTIKAILEESGPMPPKQAVEYAYQVLDALQAAHAAGIIHRDVKPQNIIINKNGVAKLADFGIARDARSSTVTFSGATVLGSVHYLSPEQATNKPVSAESDLYSVGITLYEMLTGQVPFTGDNSVAIALMHINDAPVPPQQVNSRILPALNDVVLKALRKNPEERYRSAEAMRADLLRTQYEPYGDFAKNTEKSAGLLPVKPVKQKKRKWKLRLTVYFKIALIVAAVVMAMVIAFISIRSSLQQEKTAYQIVPSLTARSVEEAAQRAENYGFLFEIQEYETSDTVPYGNIINQTPESGINAREGSTIYGIVSLGPNELLMPDLSGMTLDEATSALESVGLMLGSVSYQVSSVRIGYVCAQTIPPQTEVQPGQAVSIWISATSASGLSMPPVVGLPFDQALTTLRDNALTILFVRPGSRQGEPEGNVIEQTPLPSETVQRESRIDITVNDAFQFPYAADIAFNLDIAQSKSPVMVTITETRNGVQYERILYESTLEKGYRIPVSFTAYSQVDGLSEVIVYINGFEVRRQEVSFTFREGS